MRKRAVAVGLGVAALALAGGAWAMRGEIAVRVLQAGAAEALANPVIDGLTTGLHAGFCGTGSPMPDRARAGPCLAVVAGGRLFVFDSGEGSAETLSLMGLTPARTEAVFLTHLHSDHIDGLGSLALQRWAGGSATAPLDIYGPEGTARVIAGVNETYAIDSTYRVAHHGPSVTPPSGYGYTAREFAAPAKDGQSVVYDKDGVRVTAFWVDHAPIEPALGYIFSHAGRTIVISGDTKACECVEKAAAGADLLVHEALSRRLTGVMTAAARGAGQQGVGAVFHDIENYHATPTEIAGIATRAKVKAVALTHIAPALPLPGLDVAFMEGADRQFDGPFWMARDGDLVSIDANGTLSRRNTLRR